MWFKLHPWVFPAFLGAIGLFYLLVQIPLIFGKTKDGHSHSAVPFIGGIHFLIAGLISPCKWLALLCLLDYYVVGSIYWHFNPDALNCNDETNNEDDEKSDSSE